MKQYRIIKYNPAYRVDSKYIIDEWTDYSDIGKEFNHVVLTNEEYTRVESNYINCMMEIIQLSNITSLQIKDKEIYDEVNYVNDIDQILSKDADIVIRECLRNKIWCRLESENFFIHFGYDYYVYIGCKLKYDCANKVSEKYGLFCELFPSPYKKRPAKIQK